MEALEVVIRKICPPPVTVSDTNLLSVTAGKSSKSSSTKFSGLFAQPGSFFSCFDRDCKSRNLLKIYFDFAYYIGCSPFHFVNVQNENSRDSACYRIKSWKPQQILCALLHTIGVFRLFTEVRGVIPHMVLQSPVHYFAIIGGALRILFKVVTIKRFWCNQNQFLDVLNFMAADKRLPDCHIKIPKILLGILCGLCFVMPVLVALKSNIVAPPTMRNSTWWDRRLVSDGRFAFFLINRADYNSSGNTAIPDTGEISALDYSLGLLMGIGLVERLVMGFYFDASLLLGVLTLWTTSYAFSTKLVKTLFTDQQMSANSSLSHQKSLKESMRGIMPDKSEKWVKLYDAYKGIRTLSQLINNAFGSMITTFLAESILYHSMNMDAVILTEDIFRQAQLFFFIVSSGLTFLYAADICSQMDSLKTWLAIDENRKCIPLDELNIVLHELQTNVVGIRGSNIFTITYSLVWNVIDMDYLQFSFKFAVMFNAIIGINEFIIIIFPDAYNSCYIFYNMYAGARKLLWPVTSTMANRRLNGIIPFRIKLNAPYIK